MKRLEFSTHVKDGSTVTIPDSLAGSIPKNSPVHVILMVDDVADLNFLTLPTLGDLIAEIRNSPSISSNIHPESGLLARHLATSPKQSDEDFKVEAWNQTWDDLESEMDADALASENDNLDTSLK